MRFGRQQIASKSHSFFYNKSHICAKEFKQIIFKKQTCNPFQIGDDEIAIWTQTSSAHIAFFFYNKSHICAKEFKQIIFKKQTCNPFQIGGDEIAIWTQTSSVQIALFFHNKSHIYSKERTAIPCGVCLCAKKRAPNGLEAEVVS